MTRIGIGTEMRGRGRESNHTRMGFENFNALIKICWKQGLRWFDSADLYGTHQFLARALKQFQRKDYVIVSKIWWRSGLLPERERLSADILVERFLKELKTDYIDICLLHCLNNNNWTTKLSDYMEALDKVKRKGMIRAHGVSCHNLGALKVAAEEPWVDTVHARINPFGVNMDAPTKDVEPVLRKMHENDKGVIGMKILGEGKYADDSQKKDKAITYVLQGGFVDAMTIGFEKPQHVTDFTARVRKVPKVKA